MAFEIVVSYGFILVGKFGSVSFFLMGIFTKFTICPASDQERKADPRARVKIREL